MEEEKLSMLISKLEIVHMKLRTIMEETDLSANALSGLNESYSLISECREMLHEEEVKNEISGLSQLDA